MSREVPALKWEVGDLMRYPIGNGVVIIASKPVKVDGNRVMFDYIICAGAYRQDRMYTGGLFNAEFTLDPLEAVDGD